LREPLPPSNRRSHPTRSTTRSSALSYVATGIAGLSPTKIEALTFEELGGSGFFREVDPDDQNAQPGFALETAGEAEVRGFIEFRARRRTVWTDARKALEDQSERNINLFCPVGFQRQKSWHSRVRCFEVDLRFQMLFPGGDQGDVTSLAGSGDLGATLSGGWPIVGMATDGFSYAISADAFYSVTTDRAIRRLRDREALGLSLNLGVPVAPPLYEPAAGQPKKRLIEMSVRGLWGRAKFPDTIGLVERLDGDLTAVVAPDGRDFTPSISYRDAVSLDADVLLPFARHGYLVANFNVISATESDAEVDWSLRVGITIPLAQVLAALDPRSQ